MNSLLDISFWIYFLYFFVAVFLAFYIPGYLLIHKLKLNLLSEIVLSLILGMIMFSLQGFIFGFLHLRGFSYGYIFFSLIIYIEQIFTVKIRLNLRHFKLRKPDLIILTTVVLGTLVQLSSVFLNGIKFKDGLYFCCGVPDTLFHLSLTNELIKHFPPNEPGANGVLLQNYHYLSNLATSELIRLFHLPLIATQYQYMTVLLSLLLGLSAIVLADILNLEKLFKRWLVFLLYFSGDILFMLPFLSGKGLNFSFTTLENASSLWISPPRFYSIVILIGSLSLLILWLKRKDLFTGILMAIAVGSLIGFKVYLGAIILSGLTLLGTRYLLQKDYKYLLPIVLSFLVSLLIYLPVNRNAGGVIFSGFWRFEDFASQSSLGISNLELARRIFLEHGNFLRAVLYDLLFGLIYIFFSSGILMLGFLQTKKSIKKLPIEFNIVVVSGLIISCFLGFFFLQKTGGANSSQFLISIYIIGAIYAALALSYWLSKINQKWVMSIAILIIIVIGSPRVVHDSLLRFNQIKNRQGVIAGNKKIDSYKFLASIPNNSSILVLSDINTDCIFITFISNRSTFECDVGAPRDRGVDLDKRKKIEDEILFGKDMVRRKNLLLSNNIGYIYATKNKSVNSKIDTAGFNIVYENNSAFIYKYNSY